jgi:hypothetical protein
MRRDLLRELYEGELTPDQAQEIFDALLDSDEAAEVYDLLGLSKHESTAYAHGAPLEELAQWRYEGWPNVCVDCGREIDIEKFGWFAGEEREGKSALSHITCPE